MVVLLKFAVPPATLIAPAMVALSTFAVPPLTSMVLPAESWPLNVVVPPKTLTVPEPVMSLVAAKLWVPSSQQRRAGGDGKIARVGAARQSSCNVACLDIDGARVVEHHAVAVVVELRRSRCPAW